MAALYPYKYLNHIDFEDIKDPLSRYLFKFENQRSEISHLKMHEKDFLFRSMKVLEDNKGERVYILFKIPEAKEYVFDWVILTHANQAMTFEGDVQGPNGPLTVCEKRRNKRFFYEYLNVWKNQVEKGRGPYCSVIRVELERKAKEWNLRRGGDSKANVVIDKKIELIYAVFFHIYYTVKQFFDEKPKPYVVREVGGFDVVFNVYSFVHILSRHYYPSINRDIGASLNEEFEINLDYLPDEMLSLIERSNSVCPLTVATEYLLYYINSEYYILWIKYKILNETKRLGFEVRSFYKCEEHIDLDKVSIPGQCVVSIP